MRLFLLAWLSLLAGCAIAGPIAQAERRDIRIVLESEPCALSAVINLPRRAWWIERSERHEGCWGINRGNLVLFYWADKTVISLPLSEFTRIVGT